MTDPKQLVVFTLDDNHYAMCLSAVERAVRAVEVTPLPKAPEIVSGVINLEGTIVPVLNIRRRFRLPERETGLNDQFLIARTAGRVVALVVDRVCGVVEGSSLKTVDAEEIVSGLKYVTGVMRLADGMLFIHDLDEFLSIEEADALEAAINSEKEQV